MNEDSSNLRQRQETMRKAMKQEGVINEIQLYNGINSDDDRILMSFADSLNPNSPQLRFQNDNHFQIENNLQIQKNDENEFDQKYIDLLSPQNRTSLFESEQKLNTLKQQQILQKQNTLIGRRRTTAVQQGEIADKNQLICTQKEISIQSISYESKSGHQNSKQSLKQSDDTQEKNIIKNQDNPQKNHKSVDQNFEQLKQYQENILKVNIPKVKADFMTTLKISKIFINKMKTQVRSILSRNLSLQSFKIIEDRSSNYDVYIKRDLIMVLLYKISRNYKDSQSDLKYINYVVFFKYLDIPKKLNELETKLHFSESTQNWLKLLKLEIVVVILAHVAACIFLRIGLSEVNQGQDCWITKFQIDDQTIWGQYLVSFYYMIISMVTIGYGDFFPTTQYERGYIIIVALLATNVCAYSFSQISEIVKFEQAKKENFNQGMINLNQKMKLNGISMNLQQKIRKYFEYHHFSLAEKKNETDQFMEQLPFKLRQQFCLETNQKLINSVYIFKILSPKCIEQISSFIKQKYLMPDEILLESNTSNDCLYYINKGFLDIYTNCSEKKNYEKIDLKRNSLGQAIRCQLKEDCQKINQKILQRLNEVFGYEGFLLGEQNQFGLKSNGKTIVSYIDRTSFMQILKQFPDDYEKVMHIRDQTIFDIGVNVKNKLKCVSCSSNEHQYLQCPYVTYTKKYKENQLDIQRQQYKRKKYDKVQVLKTLSYIQEKAMLAYAELNDESLLYDAISYQHMQSLDGKENIDSNSFCSSQSEESEDSENKNTTQLELMTKTISKQLQEGFTQSFNQFLSEESENNKTDSKIKHEQQENTNNQKNMKSSMNHFGFQNVKQSVSEDIQFDSVQNKHNQENSAQRKKKSKTYNQQKTKQSKHNQQLNQKQRNQNNAIFDKKYSKTAEYQDMETDKSSTQHREEQKTLQESVKDSQNRSSEDSSKQNKNSNKLKKDNFLEKVFDRRRKRMTKIIELQNQLKRNRQTQAKQKENNQRVQDEIIQSNESEQILNICKQKQLISQIINQNRQSFSNLQSEKSSSPQIKSFDQIDKLLNFNDLSKQKTNFVSPLLTQSQKSPLIEQEMLKSYAPHEAMIRCQENVQDLDLLIVRKQYQLLQQQNKNNINNYVELPDNEMDIDQLKEYQFYYPKYNCKNILNRVKKIQDTLTKNSKLKDRTSISKKGAQTKKKFDRISNSSVNINGKQVTNRLRLLLVQNAQQN